MKAGEFLSRGGTSILLHLLVIFAGLGGLALEAVAIWLVCRAGQNTVQFMPIITIHIGSGLLMALAFGFRGFRKTNSSFMAFVFIFCLVLPILGIFGLLIGVWPALGGVVQSPNPDYKTLSSELIHARGPLFAARFGLGGFRTRLLQSNIHANRRLSLLMALGRRSTSAGNRLLRDLLRDPTDEIRLAAYAILDRRERELQTSLLAATANLKPADNVAMRGVAWHHLATLHWEAVYQGLAEGELSQQHLGKALQAVREALQLNGNDPSLLLLQARILARQGAIPEAMGSYASLAKYGIPTRRVLPYQAEQAFLARDFTAVGAYLSAFSDTEQNPALDKVIRFWSGKISKHAA
jgi:polysaccharide biosynthesis protein PelE